MIGYFHNDKIYKIKNLIKLPSCDIDESRINKFNGEIILRSIVFNNLYLIKAIIKNSFFQKNIRIILTFRIKIIKFKYKFTSLKILYG